MKFLLCISVCFVVVITGYGQSYNYEKALDSYNSKDFETALTYFGRELDDNPKNEKAYFYRAVCNYQYGFNAEALSDITKAIQYTKKKDKEWLAAAYRFRGDIYSLIGNTQKTIEDYSEAIRLSPDYSEFYGDRANVYFNLGMYKDAQSDYEKMLELDEGDVVARAGLGRLFLFTEEYDKAESTLNQLILLSPEYPTAYLYRCILYSKHEKHDLAIKDIFTCFVLDPTDRDIRSYVLYYV